MNYGLLQEIKKKNKIRIWIALCTQTKQIVAYHIAHYQKENLLDVNIKTFYDILYNRICIINKHL